MTTKVMVGEKEYSLFKTGRQQADQVIQLTKWLAKYGGDFFEAAQDEEGNVSFGSIADIFIKVAGVLTTDALIDLYVLVIGCSKEEADKYFDIAQLIDATTRLFDEQPSFKAVFNRFFSPKPSIPDMVEESISSEVPTDGQTM